MSNERNFEFLKEFYVERKQAYLKIKIALENVGASPTDQSLEGLEEAIFELPILTPRFPSNFQVRDMGFEIKQALASAGSPDDISDFVKNRIDKYLCTMDVSLSTIEQLMLITINSTEDEEFLTQATTDERLWFLDQACLNLENRIQ